MQPLPDHENFDCRQGYKDHEYPSAQEEARNAFYQGFVTDFEFKALANGIAVINYDNELVWLNLPIGRTEFPKTRRLTRQRIIEIRGDHLVGSGKGDTTLD